MGPFHGSKYAAHGQSAARDNLPFQFDIIVLEGFDADPAFRGVYYWVGGGAHERHPETHVKLRHGHRAPGISRLRTGAKPGSSAARPAQDAATCTAAATAGSAACR